jgi:hypothetical protein
MLLELARSKHFMFGYEKGAMSEAKPTQGPLMML